LRPPHADGVSRSYHTDGIRNEFGALRLARSDGTPAF
jgi:hypothetical protein